jgi:hypothetical protein
MVRDRVIQNIVYVFVCLNDPGTPPDFFLCTSEEAKAKVKQYKTRGIIDLSTLWSNEFRERWDKIDDALHPVAV